MKESGIPYERMIYVCTHTRDDRPACSNADRGDSAGAGIVEVLKQAVKAAGIGRRIRVARSGCMDLCGLGPNVLVLGAQERIHLSRVSKADIPEIVRRFVTSSSSGEQP